MAAGGEAVLMLGYGGPESFQAVRPFVENVVRGRNVPAARIEAVVEQYRAIGGKSPFVELTRRQADALEQLLQSQGAHLPVYLGMLFSAPLISQTLEQMLSDRVRQAAVIIMAPHRCQASFGRYLESARSAAAGFEPGALKLEFVPAWHNHPLFIEAMAERLSQAMTRLDPAQRSYARVIFTAHSVPEEMPDASAYAEQIAESARLVAISLGHENWSVAYTSRSGRADQAWLEPDVAAAIRAAKRAGVTALAIAPIGFVCDHVEVLFDLDVQAAAVAKEAFLPMVRAATVGLHPRFIQLLAELARARIGVA